MTVDKSNSDTSEKVRLQLDAFHARIIISSRNTRNAMTLSMWQELSDVVSQAENDEAVRLISIQGDNGTFISGADISEFEQLRSDAQKARTYDRMHGEAFQAMRRATKPTIALIEGDCIGGGMALAACCDLRVASSSARFAIPAAKLGLAYPIDAVTDLDALVGPAMAKWLLFTADKLGSIEMKEAGFLQAVFNADEFADNAQRLIDRLLSRAPLTQRAAKSAIGTLTGRNSLEQAKMDADICFASQDYREGWTSFLEKRRPVFTGR